MLAGFGSLPKGKMRGLEAADYLAAKALQDLKDGNPNKRKRRHFIVADRKFLHEQYFAGMVNEKEHRRDYARTKRQGG
jgi:hypothetical protein